MMWYTDCATAFFTLKCYMLSECSKIPLNQGPVIWKSCWYSTWGE